MRTKKEINNKISEIYKLMSDYKINVVKGILYTDALSWVLGNDYLDTENIEEKNAETND